RRARRAGGAGARRAGGAAQRGPRPGGAGERAGAEPVAREPALHGGAAGLTGARVAASDVFRAVRPPGRCLPRGGGGSTIRPLVPRGLPPDPPRPAAAPRPAPPLVVRLASGPWRAPVGAVGLPRAARRGRGARAGRVGRRAARLGRGQRAATAAIMMAAKWHVKPMTVSTWKISWNPNQRGLGLGRLMP